MSAGFVLVVFAWWALTPGCTLKSPGELLKLLIFRLYSRAIKLEFLGFRGGQNNFESFSNDFNAQPRLEPLVSVILSEVENAPDNSWKLLAALWFQPWYSFTLALLVDACEVVLIYWREAALWAGRNVFLMIFMISLEEGKERYWQHSYLVLGVKANAIIWRALSVQLK